MAFELSRQQVTFLVACILAGVVLALLLGQPGGNLNPGEPLFGHYR
jgi:hypothetical protein